MGLFSPRGGESKSNFATAGAAVALPGSAMFACCAATAKAGTPKSNSAAIATRTQEVLRSATLSPVENSGDVGILIFDSDGGSAFAWLVVGNFADYPYFTPFASKTRI